ncbi:MAG: SLBB domain-containing protein [Pseudomonadota bacterium]
MSLMRALMWVSGVLLSTAAAAQPPFTGTTEMPYGMTTSLSAAPAATPAPTPSPTPPAVPPDRNIDESVFGASLFRGHFAQQSFRGFNPDYLVSSGDIIDLKLWGAFELVTRLEVDTQGNIFVPKVGPVQVANTRNAALNEVVSKQIQTVFRDNVGVYAALANAEPVKVYVTGNVNAPGLYGAWASDSLLHFLDRAGGINTETGSFLDITVRRGERTILNVNLYDFLTRGELPLMQFRDGDTIVVGPRRSTATVSGLVQHQARFEFDGRIPLTELLTLAGVDATATHVQLVRHQTPRRQAEYLALSAEELASIEIVSGDEVSVLADRRLGEIIARVEGEFSGLSQYVFPYEANLADLLERVTPTPRSDLDSVQLYRTSIAARQKVVLDEMLDKLEQSVLTARSGTREEAELRVREAELILRFIERARHVEPKGRLVLHEGFDPVAIDLEDRDVIRIPRKTNTIAVQGEVFFPSSFAYREGKSVDYYLEQAGGLTQYGDKNRIFLVRPSGELVEAHGGWLNPVNVRPGDEIMVMPKVDTKNFQFSKELVQIIYQLALSAGVVLRL